MNWIQWGAIACISPFMFGCIGENPKDVNAPETPQTPPSTTTATTAQPSVVPGNPGVEPAVYQVRTPHASILQHFFQRYVNENIPLDKRDEHDNSAKINDALEKLPKWSAESTKWTDQHGTFLAPPPDGANIRIMFDHGASAIAADGDHVVQNLTFDKESGLYIPAEKSVLAAKVTMSTNSWCDVRGRMGAAVFDMESGSVLDLTNGYGLRIDHGITDLSYDKATAETGVLDLQPNGELRINSGVLMLHKATIQGNLGVNDAVFNLQTRRDFKTDNIVFVQTKGRIYPLKTDTFPQTLMTVNGPFQFKSGSEIELFVTQNNASKIILKYPFSEAGASKPTIEGKLRFTPYNTNELSNTTGDGIVIIDSDLDFDLGIDVSQLITHNILLKKRLSIAQKGKQLYLKIENTDINLSATPQLKQAIETLRFAEFKSNLYGQQLSISDGAIQFFTTASQRSDQERFTSARVFGLSKDMRIGLGTVNFLQMLGQASVNDDDYRFLSEAQQPFWALHHKVTWETPIHLNAGTISPSVGLSHWMLPDTIFQDSFQTLHPEIGFKSSLVYKAVGTDTLTLNSCYRALYMKDQINLQSPSSWVIESGLSVSLKTSCLTFAIGMINPLSLRSETMLSFQYVY